MLNLGNVSEHLIAELAATIQATGTQWSEVTIQVVLRDLGRYPEEQVIHALSRCRVELKFKLTVGDIIERIDDGRPAADEAWAHVSRALDERVSVVATDEALQALGEVRHLADETAARMAFRAAYQRIVLRHKADGVPPQWVPSLGHDPKGRARAVAEATERGRLLPETPAPGLLPRNAGQLDAVAAPIGVRAQLAKIREILERGMSIDRK
jgi:hypothetical protein